MPDSALEHTWADISDKERDELVARLDSGEPAHYVADTVGIKVETLKRRIREWRRVRGIEKPEAEPGHVGLSRIAQTTSGCFDDYWDLFCEMIGRDPDKKLPKGKKHTTKNRRKVVVLCDIHGKPNPEVFRRALAEKPEGLCYDGDIFDCFAFSRFPKDHIIPIHDEIAAVRAMLEVAADQVEWQELNAGNHDDRAKKYFVSHVDPDFLPLCQWNLLELASANIPNVTVADNRYDFTTAGGHVINKAFQNTWVIHLGDALIGHAEISRKGDLRSVESLASWASTWHKSLGFDEPRLIIQGHIHGAGEGYPKAGHQKLIEGGFAGDIYSLQYAMSYGTVGNRPPVHGYTVFEQDRVNFKWVTDLTTARFIQC